MFDYPDYQASIATAAIRFVAIDKQIELIDRKIRETHNYLADGELAITEMEGAVRFLNDAWRLRAQLCAMAGEAEKDFVTKSAYSKDRSVLLEEAARNYR